MKKWLSRWSEEPVQSRARKGARRQPRPPGRLVAASHLTLLALVQLPGVGGSPLGADALDREQGLGGSGGIVLPPTSVTCDKCLLTVGIARNFLSHPPCDNFCDKIFL